MIATWFLWQERMFRELGLSRPDPPIPLKCQFTVWYVDRILIRFSASRNNICLERKERCHTDSQWLPHDSCDRKECFDPIFRNVSLSCDMWIGFWSDFEIVSLLSRFRNVSLLSRFRNVSLLSRFRNVSLLLRFHNSGAKFRARCSTVSSKVSKLSVCFPSISKAGKRNERTLQNHHHLR